MIKLVRCRAGGFLSRVTATTSATVAPASKTDSTVGLGNPRIVGPRSISARSRPAVASTETANPPAPAKTSPTAPERAPERRSRPVIHGHAPASSTGARCQVVVGCRTDSRPQMTARPIVQTAPTGSLRVPAGAAEPTSASASSGTPHVPPRQRRLPRGSPMPETQPGPSGWSRHPRSPRVPGPPPPGRPRCRARRSRSQPWQDPDAASSRTGIRAATEPRSAQLGPLRCPCSPLHLSAMLQAEPVCSSVKPASPSRVKLSRCPSSTGSNAPVAPTIGHRLSARCPGPNSPAITYDPTRRSA